MYAYAYVFMYVVCLVVQEIGMILFKAPPISADEALKVKCRAAGWSANRQFLVFLLGGGNFIPRMRTVVLVTPQESQGSGGKAWFGCRLRRRAGERVA
jgi:hypothetical protein